MSALFTAFEMLYHWLQDPAFDIALTTFCMVVMRDSFEAPEPQRPKEEQINFQTMKSEEQE